jgi:hypothetical protein
MDDVPAHAGKGGLRGGESGDAAADHDRQRAGHCPDLPARHRRVEKVDAQREQTGGDLARGSGADGTHVDRHQPGPAGARHPVLTEHHLLDVGRIGDHRNHQIHLARERRRTARRSRSGSEQWLHGRRAARPDGELVAPVQQIERHRAPHDSQTDEPDFHFIFLRDRVTMMRWSVPCRRAPSRCHHLSGG